MKRLLVNLPDELHEKIRREAFDNHVSMSSLIIGKIDLPPTPAHLEVFKDAKPTDFQKKAVKVEPHKSFFK